MTRPSVRPRRRRRRTTSSPSAAPKPIPLSRAAILLPVLAFSIALVVQTVLRAAGLASDHPLRVFGTPLIAAAVVFLGLRPYPRPGRIRLALMVALGLFLFALFT